MTRQNEFPARMPGPLLAPDDPPVHLHYCTWLSVAEAAQWPLPLVCAGFDLGNIDHPRSGFRDF